MLFPYITLGLQVDNETYPQSELRFGYGLMYESYGKMVHGLNRYNMIVGLKFPDLSIIETHLIHQIYMDWCEQFRSPESYVLYKTCTHVLPAYQKNLERIQYFQDMLKKIIKFEIPALLPGFVTDHMKIQDQEQTHQWQQQEEALTAAIREPTKNKSNMPWKILEKKIDYGQKEQNDTYIWNYGSRVVERFKRAADVVHAAYQTAKRRVKRWVAAAASLVIEGISAYMNYRKDSQLKKGMKMLMKNQHKLADNVMEVRKDFMALAKTSAEQIEMLKLSIQRHAKKIDKMWDKVQLLVRKTNEQSERIIDNSKAILFLASSLIGILETTEKYKMLLMQLQLELDHFLDALDALTKGYLSHTVIRPDKLEHFLKQVKQNLVDSYPEFEIITMALKWYYQVPLITFGYSKGMLAISIPIFVKPRIQEILTVFQIKSTPVPYHMNPSMIDENESKDVYTQVKPTAELLAMSSDTNIALQIKDLKRCHKIGPLILCEQVMLIRHHTEHTCESAIYHELTPEEIKYHCKENLVYWKNLKPPPTVFDAGENLLLAHLPEPWRVQCKHTDQVLSTMESSPYCVIEKSDLCGCSITAGSVFVQDNIVYCKENPDANIQLWYPVNMMAMLYQYLDHIRGSLTDMTVYQKPYVWDPREVEIIQVTEEGVMTDPGPVEINYPEAMKDPLQTYYVDMADKSIALQDPSEYFKSKPLLGFSIIAGGVAIVGAVMLFLYILKASGVDIKLQSLGATVGKLATVVHAWQSLPKSSSDNGKVKPTSIEIQINNLVDCLILVVQVMGIIILMYCILFWVMKGVRAVYHFVKAYSLNDVQIVNTWWKHFSFDRTDVFVQLVNSQIRYSMEVYLGFYFGNPEDVKVQGEFKAGDLELEKYCLYDLLIVDWMDCNIQFNNCNLQLPQQIQVGMLQKYLIRYMMKQNETAFRLVVYNRCSNKVRAITKLCPLTFQDRRESTFKEVNIFEDMEDEEVHLNPEQPMVYKTMTSFTTPKSTRDQDLSTEPFPPPPSPNHSRAESEVEHVVQVHVTPKCMFCGKPDNQSNELACDSCRNKGLKGY